DAPAEQQAILAVVVNPVGPHQPIQRARPEMNAEEGISVRLAAFNLRVLDELRADTVAGEITRHRVPYGHALGVKEVDGGGLATVQGFTRVAAAIRREVFDADVLNLVAREERKGGKDFAVVGDGVVHVEETIEAKRVAVDADDGADAGCPAGALLLIDDGDAHAGREAARVLNRGDELAIVGVNSQF